MRDDPDNETPDSSPRAAKKASANAKGANANATSATKPAGMPRAMVLGIAVAIGFLGPTLTTPQDHAAGAPFVYEPPPGFVASDPNAGGKHAGDAPAQMWMQSNPRPTLFPPRVSLSHTMKKAPMDQRQVADIARGMPDQFEASGIAWTSARNESRTRKDGALVGVLFGDCKRGSDQMTFRTLQFAFPDDDGTSIVTASYTPEDGKELEPAFLASIDTAKGVAVRVKPPPTWLYAAWGAGGLVVAYLVQQMMAKKKAAP